jgi:hypothetical protein
MMPLWGNAFAGASYEIRSLLSNSFDVGFCRIEFVVEGFDTDTEFFGCGSLVAVVTLNGFLHGENFKLLEAFGHLSQGLHSRLVCRDFDVSTELAFD